MAVGFLLLISLVVNTVVAIAGTFLASVLPASEFLLHAADLTLSLIATTALFAAIYKIMPDTYLEWTDVWLGSAVTSLLFTLGKFFLGLYLGRESFASIYSAAASVVVLILWVYYSGQVFFLARSLLKYSQPGTDPGRAMRPLKSQKVAQAAVRLRRGLSFPRNRFRAGHTCRAELALSSPRAGSETSPPTATNIAIDIPNKRRFGGC